MNIPVNAIAPTSGSHLRDKLQRLLKLMEGQTVDIGSRSTISAGCHPSGLLFCKELLAKKIVVSNSSLFSNLKNNSMFVILNSGYWWFTSYQHLKTYKDRRALDFPWKWLAAFCYWCFLAPDFHILSNLIFCEIILHWTVISITLMCMIHVFSLILI